MPQQTPRDRARLGVVVISWTGQHANARQIQAALRAGGYDAAVVWSDCDSAGPGCAAWREAEGWQVVPDAWFFAGKFAHALAACDTNLLMTITADACCADWVGLADACLAAFDAQPALAVWSPVIAYSYWDLQRAALERISPTGLTRVFQTDSIVWAVDARTLRRLRSFDYTNSTYGFGIDTAAAMFAHANGLLVAIDAAARVRHPHGTGYDVVRARKEGGQFLQQLDAAEALRMAELTRLLRRRRRGWPARMLDALSRRAGGLGC